ncbi:MAG: pyridoxamine 5'-phosphate oxidase family protein [Dehalococcoidia bacterium]|jgi:PPOX class probable F420-dependent enzyme|nr:pyridoxamine 5'-phosphate oxidase family protein [Dehalococcoidia bacterium]
MSLHMTRAEREAFLAEVHIGVLSIADGDSGPSSAPIWYLYEAGGDLQMSMGPNSHKARLLAAGTRVTLVAQTETAPYKYVSVEGTVVSLGPAPDEDFTLRLASRYLGEEAGRRYASGGGGDSLVATIRIERWMTTDYSKR